MYDKYVSVMFGICLRYAKDADSAKDILQDAFIKVFSKLKQYNGHGSFEGWLRRVFINTALEKFRNKTPILSLDDKAELTIGEVPENIISELSAGELLEMIQDLSPQYRLVFNLYAIEGYSHKEIAESLGISEGTSKSNLSRARSILQKRIISLSAMEGRRKKVNEG